MHRLPTVLTALVLAASPAPRAASTDAVESQRRSATPVQGMTVSCQTWGWEWGTDEMVESMRELRALGVNWIAIHPYAGIRGDGSVRWRRGEQEPTWLTRPIREAHALGLHIMIKPHLAYWGSPFRWRGDIRFDTEEQWQRFFDEYRAWLAGLAEVCADADAFVVGTELDRTLDREAEWRQVIAAVRERFDGPLTYAANWTDYELVPFWDALDVIGVQAYFPLAEQPGLLDAEQLQLAWAGWMDRLTRFSEKVNRRVVLAELGYARSEHAAVRPWEGREGGADAEEIQRRCLAAALAAIDGDDRVVGAFLWKWFAGPHPRENFLMTTPAMREVIRQHWSDP